MYVEGDEQMVKNVHTLIIGAGISGLTYAACTKDDYVIVEKEDRPGGLCKTFYQDGFVWDYAGHFFHFATPEIRTFFEQKISATDMVKCVKDTNINYNGTSVNYPFQMNIHQLPKDEFIDCLYDLFHRAEKNKYENFEDMLYGKFGKSITEKFLKPYNEKLYACDLNELDTDAMGRFFPYANPEQIIDNMKNHSVQTYNSTFDYPLQGAQFFIDLILAQIDKERLLLNAKVSSIDLDKKMVLVNGDIIKYEVLINTIPVNHFVKILSNGMKNNLKNVFSCNKVLIFNLGFDKQAENTSTHWTYFPMKDCNFYRAGYYSNILGTDRLSMYIEIGYRENDIIDVDEQLKVTLENLRKLRIISDHNLIAYNSLVINPGYVHITEQSIREVEKLKKELKQYDVYTIGRYGKWTYCSIEDCIIDAMRLANGR